MELGGIVHSGKQAGAKHGVRDRHSENKPRSRKGSAKKRFPGRMFDDRMEKVEAGVRKEMEAERKAVKKPGEKSGEGEPDLLRLFRPIGKVRHAALGLIDDDEYGD